MFLHAVLQGFVNWVVESPLQPDLVEVHAPCGPVLVVFRVPACALAFGEHLRVVGGCAELGGWDPVAAPSLEWAEGDNWTAAVALPPGQHAFKLVIVRNDGSVRWEDGGDRSLQLLRTPAARVTCRFGDTAGTQLDTGRSGQPGGNLQVRAGAEGAASEPALVLL